jgi:hypothetical protein
MKKGLGIVTFLGFLLLITIFSTHSLAALEVKDDPDHGPASIIYDPSTGLEWLELTFSVNRSYSDVSSQFEAGGDFEGFRHATVEEVLALISEAGITSINEYLSDPTIAAICQKFAQLVAPRIFHNDNPAALGITGTQFVSSSYISYNSVSVYKDTYPDQYIVSTAIPFGDTFYYPLYGHWLVRQAVLDPKQPPKFSFNVIPKKLNVKKKGVIPAVIHGTQDLDVNTIDPGTIKLEGCSPVHWKVAGRSNRLKLKFDAQEIVSAIDPTGDLNYGDEIALYLTGNLHEESGGDAIIGQDTVLIIGKPKTIYPEE